MKLWPLAIGVLALGQLTLIGRLDPSLPEPNLVLAAVAAGSWLRGGRAGMTWALAGGFLLDLGASGPLGVHALAMLAAAYAAGVLATAFTSSGVPLAAVAGMVAAAVYGGVVLGAADLLGIAAVPLQSGLGLVAGEVLLAGVLTPCCVLVLSRLAPEAAVEW